MPMLLVVDDDPLVQQLLKDLLHHAGYEVELASDGVEGLACCARRRYGLVIVDLMMPNKDGLAMIEELRRIDPGAKILALSGWMPDKVDLLNAAAKLGADDVSQKPFHVPVFLNKVQRLLNGGPAERDRP